MTMSCPAIHELNPLEDARWDDLVAAHPRASVFHSRAWLEALRRTYGYEPVAIATGAPGCTLRGALVFCRVDSWLTGRRWVSLPFSDHCEPLVSGPEERDALLGGLPAAMRREKLRYLEIRPRTAPAEASAYPPAGWRPDRTYFFHEIDLTPPLETLLAHCHKDSTQRKIRRAEREKLVYEEGASPALLDSFYHLLIQTRRRQSLPPQPKAWFRHLAACFAGDLKVRVASRDGRPLAAILTLRHKDAMVYKYGCSDAAANNLGGMHLLLWTAIAEAKAAGLRAFDLGRSAPDNPGLATFKDRWGATRSTLRYATRTAAGTPRPNAFPASNSAPRQAWKDAATKYLFAFLPDPCLRLIGTVAYRHIG